MKFIIAQCIGFIGTIISLYIVQLKKINHILIGEVIANLIIALNYVLLGGDSGAGVCVVATVQTIVSYYFSRKKKKFPMAFTIIFMILYLICFIATYQSAADILSFACAVLFALAIIQEKSAKYRLYLLLNSLLWLVYDYDAKAYSTMLTHVMLAGSTLLAMIRLDIKQKTKNTNEC